jgi:hypothetical protein
MMETIKQAPGLKDCMACVAAMATGTTVEDYKKYCHEEDLSAYQDLTFIRYLWYRGFMAGFYFGGDGVHGEITVEQLGCVDISRGPALLCVESAHKWVVESGNSHAVYWDGKMIHDPNPDWTPDDGPYKIISVLPIVINKT